MERHKGDLARRGTTLSTDSETRMRRPPPQGRAFEDWGSSFCGRSPGVSSGQTRLSGNPTDEDSFTKDDSYDELDLIGLQPKRASQDPKASGSSLPGRFSSEECASGSPVAFFVDGQQYEPHPDYQVDGKRLIRSLKFKKNKGGEENSNTKKTLADSTVISGKFTGQTATQTRASSSRHDPLRKPFRPPTRVTDSAQAPRTRSTVMKMPVNASLINPDQDKTPRPAKAPPKPRPVKKNKTLQASSEDGSPPTRWGVTKEEERKEIGKAKVTPWPMDDFSPVEGSDCPVTVKASRSVRRISPPRKSSNARNNVRAFPMDLPSPPSHAESENNAMRTKDKQKYAHIPPTTSYAHRDKSSPSYTPQSFPVLSPLSSPAKPPSSSTQGSSQFSQPSRGRKRDKKGKSSSPVVHSSDDSQSEVESLPSRSNVRPFPMGTQMLESIRNPSAKRGSSDAEENTPSTEWKKNKRARGADEMYVRSFLL